MLCFRSEARASRWCGTKADANAAHAELGGRRRREETELTHLRTNVKKKRRGKRRDRRAERVRRRDGACASCFVPQPLHLDVKVRDAREGNEEREEGRETSASKTHGDGADGAGSNRSFEGDGNALATRTPRWTTRLTSTLARAASIRTTIGTGEMRGAASDGAMVRVGTETPAQGREIQRD